ncbi:MAG: carboxymuconolactone decarboxylase family protein, partial [Vicinamibacteria bacterium]
MAHVKPLSRDEVPQFRDRFEQYAKTRGFVPNSLLTMSRRPAIAEAFMELNRAALRLAWKGATAPNQTTAA